jgi:serine/threonine-protein kinase
LELPASPQGASILGSVESRYKIIERIDSGGMAEVFKGRARAIHGIEKTVAIKRILPHLARNRKFVAMFLDEARLSVYLNHANIVQVFDIARSDGDYFIVMEFVEGANLRTLLEVLAQTGRTFDVEKGVRIAADICRGLAYAHERRSYDGRPLGIVHRDVSPPNVLISLEGEVKLVDFGLAKAASQLEHSDPEILKGKLGYMSPEQAYGKAVDHRADVFAAGILLYEMLSGCRLFKGDSDLATLELVREAKIPPLRQHNPRVLPDLESIVRRALAKDLSQRYQSARHLEDDLWRFLFAHGLKVTPLDIGNWVRETMVSAPKERVSTEEIGEMIQEEILRLFSIEDYDLHLPEDSPPPMPQEGSRPIRVEELTVARDRRDAPLGNPAFMPLTEILEPEAEAEPPPEAPGEAPARAPRSRIAWWILALLVLGALGAGAFYLLRSVWELPPDPPAQEMRGR